MQGHVDMINLDPKENDTSLTLDLLRAVAAQMVCVGPAIIFFVSGSRPQWLPVMQNIGVLIFFLISGFVIAATLSRRSGDPDYGFLRFFVDRFARIYSGLLPALVLILAVDRLTLALTGESSIAATYTSKTLFGNLLMLEGYWGLFQDRLRFGAFGSASPLWTLAIEWHIYMFVGAVFFAIVRRRHLIILACVAAFSGQIALHYLTGSFQVEHDVGMGLFTLWMMGFALYFLIRPMNYQVCCIAFIGFSGTHFLITRPYYEYDFIGYLLLAGAFASIASASQSSNWLAPLNRYIKFFADYSFSLYLVHYSIMMLFFLSRPAHGWMEFFITIILSNLAAIVLSILGESHHKAIANRLYAGIRPRLSKGAADSRV